MKKHLYFLLLLNTLLLSAQTITPLATDPVVTILSTTVTVDNSLLISIEIPGFQPSEVFYDMTPLSQNVRLDGAKKIPRSQNGIIFTVFEFTFTFLKEGSTRLPTITATYNNKHHRITLPTITVVPDLASIIPTARWHVETIDEPTIGTPIKIELVVQDAKRTDQLSIDFSKQVLFEQINSSTIIGAKNEDSNTIQGVVVGTYELTPLVAGEIPLPTATVAVETYAEKIIQIRSEAAFILATENKTQPYSYQEENSYIFEQAFTESHSSNGQEIAKQTMDNQEATKKREAGKQNTTIVAAKTGMILCFVGAFVLALVALIFKFFLKRKQAVIVLSSIVLLFLGFFCLIKNNKTYVISSGSVVRAIPELSVKAIHHLESGSEVLVLSESPDWLYIRLPTGQTGWIQKSTVLENDKK